MNPIPILGLGIQSGFPSATAQSRINCYLEAVQDAEKTAIHAYGTPGLELFYNFGETPVRGMLSYGDYLYCVHRGTVYKIDNAGTAVSLGTIGTTTGRVGMACNGQEVLIVDGTSTGYVYEIADDATVTITIASPGVITWTGHGLPANAAVQFTTTGALPTGLTAGTTYYVKTVLSADTFTVSATSGGTVINTSGSQSGTHTGKSVLTQITDTDFPALVMANFVDGYFLGPVADTGNYYISGLYDGLSWNALDFANAEASPDDLVGTYVNGGYVYLLNEYTTEIHGNTGAADFPFSRIGSAVDWGLISPFSVSKLGTGFAFLGRDRMGQNRVVMMEGASATPISSHDLDRILNDNDDLSGATAYSFMTNGHPFYVLNVGGETWAYDLSTGCWSQLKSHDLDRHRGEISETFVNKIMVSDYANGKLYRMADDVYTDNGDPIRMEIVSKHITNNRDWMTIDEIQIDFEQGVGLQNGQGSNPQAMLSVSKDAGHTWGNERWADMGRVGKYKTRTIWRRFGRARDFTLKLAITDPVKRCVTGAYMRAR